MAAAAKAPRSSSGTTTADSGKPTPGGKVVYGVESDTGGGFCLPSGQLAISGVMVADSIYDPLTWPNDKGEYVPYLAESVTPNADFTEWTIKLRPGITFTDGSPTQRRYRQAQPRLVSRQEPEHQLVVVLARAQAPSPTSP